MADNLDPELIRQFNEVLSEFVGTTRKNTALTEEQAAAARASAEATKNWTNAGNAAAKSLSQFGSSLFSAEKGMTKYGSAADSAGDAALSIGKNFGVLGTVVGGLTKILGMAVGAVFKQNDAMLKASDSLAQFGVTGGITSKEIMTLGQQAGYASGQLEEWTDITKSLGTDITALGVSATEGVKIFSELTKMDEKLLAGYRNLGLSQQQVNKTQADYVRLQVASGKAISDNLIKDGTLRKSSLAYIDNLLELSALTGMEVEELKKKQLTAMADQAFATKMAMMQEREMELRAQGNTAEAEKVKADREAKEKILETAVAMGMTGDQLKGLTHTLASGSYNELSASFLRMGVNIQDFEKGLAEGKKTPLDFVHAITDGVKNTRAQLGDAIILNKDLADVFGSTTEMMALETKLRGKSKEEQEAIMKEELASRKKQMTETNDDAKNARNTQETLERRAKLGADAIIGLLNGPVTNAFEKLMKALSWMAKGIAKFAGWLLGDAKIADMFDTPEDIKKVQTETANELQEINEKIKKTKASIEDPVKAKQEADARKKSAEEAYITQAQRTADLKKQYKEETDISKKAQLSLAIKESSEKEVEANKKMREADAGALEAKRASTNTNRLQVEKKLEELEKKRLEKTEKLEKTGERLLNKQVETGQITADMATAQRSAKSTTKNFQVDPALLKKLSDAGITDTQAQANILAQIQAESGGKAKSESMKYTPEGLLKTFPKKFKDLEEARNVLAQGDEAVGNKIYGGRMGNDLGEGYKYRGRGLIQLTGKDNYRKYGKLLGLDLLSNPDLANDPEIAQQIAVEYFRQKQKSGIDLRSSAAVSKAVGHVDIGGIESVKRRMMASSILDQLPKAALGGMFSGPATGYPVMLHGNEAVIPIPDLDSIEKQNLPSTVAANPATTNTTVTSNGTTVEMISELVEMLSQKLDTVVAKLSDGNDIQDRILKYSKS